MSLRVPQLINPLEVKLRCGLAFLLVLLSTPFGLRIVLQSSTIRIKSPCPKICGVS